MEEVPIPAVGDGDVLIKVKKSAICGTDIHIYKWDEWAQKTIPVPMVVGHEFVGEIAEVGKGVTEYKVGQRVSGEGHITCGHCRNCRTGKKHLCHRTKGVGIHRPGSFAEYFTLPQDNVFIVPEEIEDDMAAIFDPLGNAVHTALSYPLAGEDVLITGAGPIGLMGTAIAKHCGARNIVVTDINKYRLDLAHKSGATCVVDISRIDLKSVMETLKIHEGFDVGLEMSGVPSALQDQLAHSVPGAHIALLGILPSDTQIDWDQVIFKGLHLKGIYGREIFDTWYKMMHLLQGGLDLSNIITHQFSIDDFQIGFNIMMNGDCGKVILNWE
ncbi:L-threonine 3-dehydrogenase [Chlamydiales bacterium SCGC AG-110-P3]|nr:L-threonine 3-dehydrogenase [Chlamydiales bacterium SCGC AG-110-P3]